MPANFLITDDEGAELQAIFSHSDLSVRIKKRARIILQIADSIPHARIARYLNVGRPTVIEWRHRFFSAEGDRVAALLPGTKAAVE